METLSGVAATQELVGQWRRGGLSVGLVPTMGYLHQGHVSLIEAARAENDKVVVSIFVNPTQFGPNEDLEAYPRDKERDLKICEREGVALVFAPTVEEMYIQGAATKVGVTGLSEVLCGRFRPIHFNGVCLVCSKLFNITKPNKAYFGLKDAQQFFILERLVKDLNFDLELVSCPIVREPDGLALSSRNAYLSPDQRKAATVLSRALKAAKNECEKGQRDGQALTKLIAEMVGAEPLARLEYAEVVSTENLSQVTTITSSVLVAAALWLGKTRLIDNFIFSPPVS
ncbi:MAG: pantoate--beta-alanine ligase [Deltaproteobacteria bacterium]|nr:pantoate--beta-alanine ligase [Deltaproteobacteria bacterium]